MPRPASAAELIDDALAELAAPVALPAAVIARRRPAAPRARPAAIHAVAPPAAPMVSVAAVPAKVVIPAPAPAPRSASAAPSPRRTRLLGALGALALIAGVAALAVLIAALRPGPSAPAVGAANLVTVLPRDTAASSLTMADATALADRTVVPDASAVAPIVERSEQVVAGAHRAPVTMTGSTSGWLPAANRQLARGRAFSATEVSAGARLAVLGSSTARRLFPTGNPLGQSVSIAERAFTVVGVLTTPSPGTTDDLALVPITAAQGITGTAGGRTVERILVTASSPEAAYAAYQEANSLLLQTHHANNPFSTDFSVSTTTAGGSGSAAMRWALGALAAALLLLGGLAIRRVRRAV
jgi:putative ABC transport system permease protein